MKNLLYIGNKLSKHGATPTTIETLGPLLEQEGFSIQYSSALKNKGLRFMAMLWSVFRYSKVDIVLIDTYSTTNFWFAFGTSQLCRLLKISYIPILHGGNLGTILRSNPKICGMIFKHSFQNVSPSSFLIREFNDEGYQNVIHIPNTIVLNNYPYLKRKTAAPNLLWVRSFAKIYNPTMAVEVLAVLKQKYPQATLCMIGPEKDGSLLEAKIRAKILDVQVNFTGKLSKEDWIEVSKNYSILINTTHFDNMPVSLIEATSLGLAVVSTDVGGIPFLFQNEKNALLVPDSDVNQMVKAISRLVENPNLFSEITENGRSLSQNFEWESVKLKWLAILK